MINPVAFERPDATPTLRPSLRGVCCWYPSVHVARAAASRRYRIGNFVDMVSAADVVIGRRLPSGVSQHARTVLCLRPSLTPELTRALAALRSAGVRLVADYDDLLFAGRASGLPESVAGSGTDNERHVRLSRYAAGLAAFDAFTVATRALARQVLALAPGARVQLVPNGLSETWVAQGRALYPVFQAGDPLVIRYLAGSPSHDRDFASISEPLRAFLDAHPEVRIEVVGPLRVPPHTFPPDRLRHLPSVGYDELPRLLASAWVNLAPLESSAFNECKSAIKYLEAGAFGCPTLASPNDDVLRRQELGARLLVCKSGQDWVQALTSMLDLERRRALGLAAANDVMLRGMARDSLPSWLDVLRAEPQWPTR